MGHHFEKEGLSYGKIGKFLNIPRKTVGSICERASMSKGKTDPKPKINARTVRKII